MVRRKKTEETDDAKFCEGTDVTKSVSDEFNTTPMPPAELQDVTQTSSAETCGHSYPNAVDAIKDLLVKAREEIEYCDDFINMKTANSRAYESYRSELYEFKYKCRLLLESDKLREQCDTISLPVLPVRPKKF